MFSAEMGIHFLDLKTWENLLFGFSLREWVVWIVPFQAFFVPDQQRATLNDLDHDSARHSDGAG
jgi:hypothetical protein